MYSIKGDILLGDKVSHYETQSHFSSRNDGTPIRNVCDFVIIHWTGTARSAYDSIVWSQDPRSRASWHITIDRDGSVYVDNAGFRGVLWHAGVSKWTAPQMRKTYNYLNRYSVGIELACAGKVHKKKDTNEFLDSFGNEVNSRMVVEYSGEDYESFTPSQLRISKEIALLICKQYNCVDILGHYEISPSRKIDPGSLYPLASLRTDLHSQSWYKWREQYEKQDNRRREA